MAHSHHSLEVEQGQVKVDHLVALSLNVEVFEVDNALVSVAVSDVAHRDHIVFFTAYTDLTSASIHHLNVEFLVLELVAISIVVDSNKNRYDQAVNEEQYAQPIARDCAREIFILLLSA